MANEVNLKIKITDDGTLQVVTKKAKEAAAATDKVRKSTDNATRSKNRYNKVEKGVAGATANGTKAFAKQAGSINSGLVPAYATLAANVFAISAAFNVLSRAAEVRTLEEGFTRLGNTVGQTASLIADSIVSITDGAISMDQALRSAASGFSAGFSTAEISGLAEVAKNASIALGRDLGDSFDRLIRGVGKLEPEILDELGIFIRLDDAAEKYAQQLGRAASSLTQAERRQAFMNEALTQGQKKFAAVGGAVDPNPFNQLAASFQNLTHAILGFVNGALGPLINLLGNNTVALVGALTLFGTGVAKSMLPALNQLGEKAKYASDQQQELADKSAISANAQVKSSQKTIRSMKKIGSDTAFNVLKKKIASGKASTEELKAAIKSLELSEKSRAKNLEAEHVKDRARKEEELASIRKLKAETERLMKAKEGNLKSQISAKGARRDARTEGRVAGAIEGISMQGPIEGFKTAREELKRYEVQTAASMKRNGKFTKGLTGLQHVFKNLPFIFKTAGTAARLFGAALINAIPVIGQFIFLGGLLLEGVIKLAGSISFTSEAVENFRKVTDSVKEKVKQLNETNGDLAENFLAAEAAAALLTPKIYATGQEAANAAQEALELVSATAAIKAEVTAVSNEYKVAAGVTEEFVGTLKAFNQELATTEPGIFVTLGVAIKTLFNKTLGAVIEGVGNAVSFVTEKFTALKDGIVDFIDNAVNKFSEKFPAAAEFMGVVADGVGGAVDGIKESISEGLNSVSEFATGVISDIQEVGRELSENARKDIFITEVQDRLNELQKSAEGNKGLSDIFDGFVESLGKDGVRGALEDAIAGGASLDEAFAIVTARLENASKQINSVSDGLNNFEEQFSKTQKSFQKFAQSYEKKNPFTDMKEDIAGSITQIKAMEAATEGKSISFGDLITANAETLGPLFKGLGIDLDTLKEKGSAALDPLNADVIKAFELQETMKDRVDKAKAAVQQLSASFQFDKANAEMERLVNLIERGSELNVSDQFLEDGTNRIKSDFELRRTFIQEEAAAKKKVIDEEIALQQKILQIRLKMSGLDATAQTEVQALIDSLDDTILAKKGAIDQEADTKGLQNVNDFLREQVRLRKQIVSEAGDENRTIFDRSRLLSGADFEIKNEKGEVIDSGTTEKIAAMKELTSSMVQDLAKLGPDGEVAAAVANASFTIAGSFDQMFDVFGEKGVTKMEKFGAAAAAVASTIGAVNSIIQQQSAATIAGIDKEIEAEKKRDGKSAASLQKIQAMEKKKEQQQKKAFEMNKKMMMAQAVASTAAGIAGVLSGIKDPIVTAPLAFATALMIGAMGAAQLAIIAGTSYSGGGSSGGASVPTSVSVGQRSNSIDMAKSQGAGGELAYMRGGKGIGGPENFTPAFAGYRNRAEGGNTAFMVGEQGPELFVPETPGRIVPNDDVQASTPVNANINISAIDAAGVEDVLINQRGNIISMIREAANAQGDGFLENINVAEL